MAFKVAIEPKTFADYNQALEDSGAVLSAMSHEVTGLIWTDYSAPEALLGVLEVNPQIEWLQLPFAGVDAFFNIFDYAKTRPNLVVTSAKGAYSEPVAEHAMALSLALARIIPERSRSISWGRKFAFSFYDSEILIVGGGGIAAEFIKFLAPYRAKITVVRNRVKNDLAGVTEIQFAELDDHIAKADLVVLACALTTETHHLINAERLRAMKNTAYLVNIARGPVVDTQALIVALNEGLIAGAGLDVTDPEPLPDGHALWTAKNVLITPHTADTQEMILRMFSKRIRENVMAARGLGEWVGRVDLQLGY